MFKTVHYDINILNLFILLHYLTQPKDTQRLHDVTYLYIGTFSVNDHGMNKIQRTLSIYELFANIQLFSSSSHS